MVYSHTKTIYYKDIPISLFISRDRVLTEVYSNGRAIISKKVTDLNKLKNLLEEIKSTIDLGLNTTGYTKLGEIKTEFKSTVNYVY